MRFLRADAAPDGVAASAQAERTPRLRGARVLVVEDNPINQQVALELLQSAGIQGMHLDSESHDAFEFAQ